MVKGKEGRERKEGRKGKEGREVQCGEVHCARREELLDISYYIPVKSDRAHSINFIEIPVKSDRAHSINFIETPVKSDRAHSINFIETPSSLYAK